MLHIPGVLHISGELSGAIIWFFSTFPDGGADDNPISESYSDTYADTDREDRNDLWYRDRQ
jgi:hypothetical protein